jgi:hypothetical protein
MKARGHTFIRVSAKRFSCKLDNGATIAVNKLEDGRWYPTMYTTECLILRLRKLNGDLRDYLEPRDAARAAIMEWVARSGNE